MRIYLDNCCYNRLFDEKTQQRVIDESNAIKELLISRKHIIIGSHILKFEIGNINEIKKRLDVAALYEQAKNETVKVDEYVLKKAEEIKAKSNIHDLDALHVACALIGKADIFLTVDDKLIKACKGLKLNMQVKNPIKIGGDE